LIRIVVLDNIFQRGERRFYKKTKMRFNFKKISALATSVLMIGMTAGVAAAANYPAPFVQGGASDVAIVVGTGSGVSVLDGIQAAKINDNLHSFVSSTTTGGSTTVTGEAISLDTSSTRIWLNTSLNTAKTQLTKADLPNILGDYTFSGNVDSKLTSTIKLVTGAASGADNSGKVIFAKQPTTSTDPQMGISIGSSQTSNPLYNASATMSAINFTSSDSEGQPIELFGQKFTIASETDTSDLVLLKEAQKITLDSESNPSATVTVGGKTYTVELVSASDTSANIKVTDSAGVSDSREINEAASKKVQGLTIAVTSADETNLKLSATIIAGAEKVTITNGATVTKGDSDEPIDGTYAYIVGGTGATTEIAISVFRPDSSGDAILEGQSFTDPIFGSFKFDFAGLSSPLNDSSRGQVLVTPSGDKDMTLTITDDSGNTKAFEFAHNQSSVWALGDSNNYSIGVREMANLSMGASKTKYVVIGNEEYGHLLELYDVYNQSTGSNSVTNDRVRFRDVISGDTYDTVFTNQENTGSLDVEGKRYTVNFTGSGEDAWVQIKYPTGDSAATEYVVYPTIELQGGSLVSLYQPLNFNFTGFDDDPSGASPAGANASKLWFPDGDGYTGVEVTYRGGNATSANWTIGTDWLITGLALGAEDTANRSASATIGKMIYNFSSNGNIVNNTYLYLNNPESAGIALKEPGVVFIEGKGDTSSNDYNVVVVDLEVAPAGTSSDGVGVRDVLFSSPTHFSSTLASDSDITQDVDYYGTLTSLDSNTASKTKATISYPASQVYAKVYVGEKASAISSTPSSGPVSSYNGVVVTDKEVSGQSSKNLIIVGGSCINSAAATLVGGSLCGTGWTDKTGVGVGQFLVKGYATSTLTSKLALLVAGYEEADTTNAATYLRTQTVDTSKGYKGTSSTSAEQIVETTA
jgi:hypothetical protein